MSPEAVFFILAFPFVLPIVLAVNKYGEDQGVWFKGIFETSDENLAARPIHDLTRDHQRMERIEARLDRGSVAASGITKGIAGEQRIRLEKAVDAAARASFGDRRGDGQQVRNAQPTLTAS